MSDTSLNREMMRDKIFLEMAVVLGQLGTCSRAQVGCIITRDHRAISWGYNGAPPGMPHCRENNHGYGANVAKLAVGEGCRNATHAEANALAFAARQGISTDGGTLYVERSPCEQCARLCIAAGIARVVFLVPYRDESGVTMLRNAEVEVECLS